MQRFFQLHLRPPTTTLLQFLNGLSEIILSGWESQLRIRFEIGHRTQRIAVVAIRVGRTEFRIGPPHEVFPGNTDDPGQLLVYSYQTVLEASALQVGATIARIYLASVGVATLADLDRLGRLPEIEDPTILEEAFETGESGRFAPLAGSGW